MASQQQGIYFPGIAGDFVSTPDAAALDILGDIDIRVEYSNNTPNVASQTLLAKFTTAGNQRSYRHAIGFFFVQLYEGTWSNNGTAVVGGSDSVGAALGNDATNRLRCYRQTLRVSDGRHTFWEGPTVDGPFEIPSSGSFLDGATSIFNSTSLLTVGALGGGAAENYAGFIKRIQLRAGIDPRWPEPINQPATPSVLPTSTIVLDADFTKWPKGSTTMVAATGQTLTLNGFDLTAAQGNAFRERGVDTLASNLDLSIDGGGFVRGAGKAYATHYHGWRHFLIHDMVRRGYVDAIPDPNSLYAFLQR